MTTVPKSSSEFLRYVPFAERKDFLKSLITHRATHNVPGTMYALRYIGYVPYEGGGTDDVFVLVKRREVLPNGIVIPEKGIEYMSVIGGVDNSSSSDMTRAIFKIIKLDPPPSPEDLFDISKWTFATTSSGGRRKHRRGTKRARRNRRRPSRKN